VSPSRTRRRPLTIGRVLEALREEFPEISISKIRFLESEGLVEPARTASGYRQYTEGDVERLRFILRAQRDRFWPLKVIGEALDALDRGLEPADPRAWERPQPPQPEADPAVPTIAELREHSTVRLTLDELATSAGVDPSLLEALTGFGLLRPDAQGFYGGNDLQVAHAAAGLTGYGIEARHLRPFRTAADREVGLIEQALMTSRRESERDAEEAHVAALCLRLHAALVRGGLSAH
jgi:DNA-binding transcriptional MerR regulator